MFIFNIKNLFCFILFAVLFCYNQVLALEIVCKKCHQSVYDEILKYPFQHSNFVLNNCEGCHISGENIDLSGISNKEFYERGTNRNDFTGFLSNKNSFNLSEKQKITTIRFPNYAKEHMAVFDNLSPDSTYLIKIKATDKSGRVNESQTLSITPASISEFWVDDGQPPEIVNVEVKQVEVSVLTSAEIEWDTDKQSKSLIEYGETIRYGDSLYSGLYSRKHKMKLNGLSNNKLYHFRVISRDPFENSFISDDYNFNTFKAFDSGSEIVGKIFNGKPEFNTIKILRLTPKKGNKEDFRVAILFSSPSEVISTIEYTKIDQEIDVASGEKKHGPQGFKSWRETSIDLCINCHRQGASHPVGMSSTRTIKIPDFLPTGEGKIMTCATCHSPHGSKMKYLARLDFKRDICVLCHTDKL